MLKTIEVVFDGKAFVPTEPVDLPAGTKVTVSLPEAATSDNPFPFASPPPPPMTPEERAEWEQLLAKARATEPPWTTVDEALAYSRGRPWPEPEEGQP